MEPGVTLEAIAGPVRAELEAVERELRDAMRSVAPLISEVGAHTFGGGGKRIRPLVVLLAARLCGYVGPRAVRIAAAAELLHTATLLHDDVVDGAPLRRGRPSVNAVWGDRVAILVGDYLYARSSMALVEDGSREILWAFANAIRSMSEGEVLQLAFAFDPALSEEQYFEVIGRKTAELLATSAEAGAILGGAGPDVRRRVRTYGRELGLAFQLVDDALDYAGSDEELGKAPLADLREGKVTLPLLEAMRRASVGEREYVVSTLKALRQGERLEEGALRTIAELVARYGGAEAARACAARHAARACAALASFAPCEARTALEGLARFVVERSR